jgi:hypothetical protein
MSESRIMIMAHVGGPCEPVVVIPLSISERLTRELSEPMETSTDGMAIMFEAWGRPGGPDGFVAHRKRKFEMREEHAREIAENITSRLVEYFGRNDRRNGYTKQQDKECCGE